MERDVIPTLEECLEVFERKGHITIINDGQVLDVRKDV